MLSCCAGCPAARCAFCTPSARVLGWIDLRCCRPATGAGCSANAALAGVSAGAAPRGRSPKPASWCSRRRGCGCARRDSRSPTRCVWDGADVIEQLPGEGARPDAADAASGQLRGLCAGLCAAFRRAPADHRAVPPGTPARAARTAGECARAPGAGHRAGHAGGVRQMLRALRRGETVGLLPDQVPPDGLGVWADFFGAAGLHDDAGGAAGATIGCADRC